MIAVSSRDVMAQPKSRRVFDHGWAGQEGTDGRSPNSAMHLIVGNTATEYGLHAEYYVAEIPAMPLSNLTILSHRNIKMTETCVRVYPADLS